MKFKKIRIKNYKSITEEILIDDFSKFNVLVGPNNAGKTNVLDAFEVFFNTKSTELRREKAGIELTIENNKKSQKFTYNGGINNLEIEKEDKLVRINHSVSLKDLATEKLSDFQDNYEKEYEKFSKTLEKYFQDIQISQELFRANVETKTGRESLKRMGDGFKRLFIILFYLYHPYYEIMLIDEPELHLHPTVIKKFLKILDDHKGTQVIMTTHHPTMVQAKFLDKTWRVARNKNQSTAIYKFNQDKLDINIDRFVQEINDDNSAMLFADKALLVEGVSDSILMRGLIDKFYEKSEDIKVVYTGGVGDIDLYEKVCKIFNIPYRIMIDGDMLGLYWSKKFGKERQASERKKRELLEDRNIFVLDGDLEDNYPKKYQKKDTKPLNALLATSMITRKDFSKMKELKRVIANL